MACGSLSKYCYKDNQQIKEDCSVTFIRVWRLCNTGEFVDMYKESVSADGTPTVDQAITDPDLIAAIAACESATSNPVLFTCTSTGGLPICSTSGAIVKGKKEASSTAKAA